MNQPSPLKWLKSPFTWLNLTVLVGSLAGPIHYVVARRSFTLLAGGRPA
jgi:hypothetical protein